MYVALQGGRELHAKLAAEDWPTSSTERNVMSERRPYLRVEGGEVCVVIHSVLRSHRPPLQRFVLSTAKLLLFVKCR